MAAWRTSRSYDYDPYDRMDWDSSYSYGYGYGYDGYEEEEEDITFFRPDGDTELKSKQWCRDNGFYEIEEGLWSGDWYWRHFPEEKREYDNFNDRYKITQPCILH